MGKGGRNLFIGDNVVNNVPMKSCLSLGKSKIHQKFNICSKPT